MAETLVLGPDGVYRPASASPSGGTAQQATSSPTPPPASTSAGNGGGGWRNWFRRRGNSNPNTASTGGANPWLILLVFAVIFVFTSFVGVKMNLWMVNEQSQALVQQAGVLKAQNELRAAMATPSTAEAEKDVITIPTFRCAERAEQASGFAENNVHVVSTGKRYHIPQGCAWIRVETHVKSMSANRYLIQEEVGNGYFGCGTFGLVTGEHNTPRQCAQFVNQRRGQNLQVIIREGGDVTFN